MHKVQKQKNATFLRNSRPASLQFAQKLPHFECRGEWKSKFVRLRTIPLGGSFPGSSIIRGDEFYSVVNAPVIFCQPCL